MTSKELKVIADDIAEMVCEYPDEVRYEATEEFLEIARREDGLSKSEIQRVVALLSDRGII